jgi:hypothetical protein
MCFCLLQDVQDNAKACEGSSIDYWTKATQTRATGNQNQMGWLGFFTRKWCSVDSCPRQQSPLHEFVCQRDVLSARLSLKKKCKTISQQVQPATGCSFSHVSNQCRSSEEATLSLSSLFSLKVDALGLTKSKSFIRSHS